jgi:hypothetical protein
LAVRSSAAPARGGFRSLRTLDLLEVELIPAYR